MLAPVRKKDSKRFDRKWLVAVAGLLVLVITGGALLLLGRGTTAPEIVDIPDPDPLTEKGPAYEPFISQQLKDAYEANNDVVGWLTIEGCEIDNRVFQGKDNDYYLRKDENGGYDVWGCYFLDYEDGDHTDSVYNDRVLIIYGHSLDDYKDSEKFSKLKRYKDKKFAAQYPTIKFSSLYREYEWQIFAASDIPVSMYYNVANPTDEKFQRIMSYLKDNSYVDFGVGYSLSDQILLLSTCTSDKQVRFVVAAKLIGVTDNG